MSAAVVRHYVAVKDGIVVGSRSTLTPYRWAVLHQGADGWFASFHRDHEGAEVGLRSFVNCRPKELVETIETKERIRVGAPWVEAEAHDEEPEHDINEHAQRDAELLESCWRNS